MKGIEEVTAYRTEDGKLFVNAEMAEIHAEWLTDRVKVVRDGLSLMIKNQCRCKRAMRYLRDKEAAAMQSVIANRAARIAMLMEFIKKGSGA